MGNFNAPEFLRCVIKHGLLDPTASSMDAYQLEGFLLRDEMFRHRRLKLGISLPLYQALEALAQAEILALRERVTGVLPFKKTA